LPFESKRGKIRLSLVERTTWTNNYVKLCWGAWRRAT